MIRRSTLCALLALSAAPALAQEGSAYGCARLEEATPTPYVEGRDGVFFRLGVDLRMRHPLSDVSLDLMRQLSDALAARGVTLIYVPLPTKALAMPDHLPEEALAYGYDHEIAMQGYEDMVARLREAGIVTVNALTPMLDLPEGEFAYVPTDHHWSSAGARAVAQATAEVIAQTPGYADIAKTGYRTTELGVQEVFSPIRREIQALCRDTVPRSETTAYETEVTEAAAVDGASIFAAEAGGPSIALVGTSMSRTPAFNFDGFLAEASGLDLVNYAVTGGNQYGSMVSYMLSDEFTVAPPKYIVWENPFYNNLGEFGELPIRELIAAAWEDCTPLEVERPDANTLLAQVPGGEVAADAYIRADAGSAMGRAIQIGFTTQDGLKVQASIERTQRLEPSRFFYQYMEPFWEPHISEVQVRFDRAVSEDAALAICTNKESQS
jgi:alginate biosynthesis protein AlgX